VGFTLSRLSLRFSEGIYFNNLGDKAKITKIANYGQGVSRLNIGSFLGCSSLLSIDIGNIVSNGVSASNQYRDCTALTTVPLLNLSSVTDAYAMFAYCTALTTVPLFNLSNCTITWSMFFECTSLTTIPLLDLSSVADATNMFRNCSSLTTVPLFNLSSVTDATNMFRNCSSLTTVPLFNLSSVTDATYMFSGVTLTTQSYSDFLIHLATLPLQSGVSFQLALTVAMLMRQSLTKQI
jgi:surface protein